MPQDSRPANPLPEVLQPPISRNGQLLLESRIPARLAWTGKGDAPRVVPIWFFWDGAQCVMTSFTSGAKLAEIADGTQVAVTIDTDAFPYRGLRMSGPVALDALDDLSDEYRQAALRHLGPDVGRRWCESLHGRPRVRISLTPKAATAWDLSASPFMTDPGDD